MESIKDENRVILVTRRQDILQVCLVGWTVLRLSEAVAGSGGAQSRGQAFGPFPSGGGSPLSIWGFWRQLPLTVALRVQMQALVQANLQAKHSIQHRVIE